MKLAQMFAFQEPEEELHHKWTAITVHTARCDVCEKHNKGRMSRCAACTYQVCATCVEQRLQIQGDDADTGQLDHHVYPNENRIIRHVANDGEIVQVYKGSMVTVDPKSPENRTARRRPPPKTTSKKAMQQNAKGKRNRAAKSDETESESDEGETPVKKLRAGRGGRAVSTCVCKFVLTVLTGVAGCACKQADQCKKAPAQRCQGSSSKWDFRGIA
jgi:hypothetical protein